jgi:FKBP-type peptidyl-prolyl cis-trans isomerase (trigger factor)
MPKAILEFNLPEENDEFFTTNNALKYKICLDEIREFIRRKIKYSEEETISYENLNDEFFKILNDNDIFL